MDEDIEKIVEDELKIGSTYKEIREKTGKNDKEIMKIKERLMEAGKLKKEDIKAGKENKKKIFLQTDSTNIKIRKYKLAGLSQMEISKLLGISQVTVGKRIEEFKKFGLISQDEIEKAREQYLIEQKEDSLLREQVLINLQKGRVKNDFAQELGMTERGVNFIQQSLIEEGKITQKEIDEAVEQFGKTAQKEKKVLELLKQGYNYTDISRKINLSTITIRKLKEKFVNSNQLDDDEYKEKKMQRKKDKNTTTSKGNTKDEEETILEMLRMGYDTRTICRKTKLARIDVNNIQKNLIKKLKENGEVTDKEIKKWKANRQKETKKERNKDKKRYDKQIIDLLKKGYLEREIAVELGKALTTISVRVSLLKNKGKITEEEIKTARQTRGKREDEIKGQEEDTYKEYMKKAKKVINLETKWSDEKIATFIDEIIKITKKQQDKGKLKLEELKQLDELIFITKTDIKIVLEVVRLHLKSHDYKGGLYFLNSINNVLEGEDKEKIKQVIETMKKGEKKITALQMLKEGNHTLDEIHSVTRIKYG